MNEIFTEPIRITDTLAFWSMILKKKKIEKRDEISNSLIKQALIIKDELFKKYNLIFQIFNPEMVLSLIHLKYLVYHVDQVFKLNDNISNQQHLEFLLYLSLQRQIKIAIEKVGIKDPDSKDENISFGIIIFGQPNKINDAINNIKKIFYEFDFIPFKAKNKKEILTYFQKENISKETVNRFLWSKNVELPINIPLNLIFESQSETFIQEIADDIINESMIRLYINNCKDITKYIEEAQ